MYGKVHKLLHWLLAINISATLIFSIGMASLTDAEKAVEYGQHGVSVTTIFVLMLIRTIWRLFNPPPALPEAMPKTHQLLAHGMHLALYVLIFAQIAVGILLASATAVPFVADLYAINYSAFGLATADDHAMLLLLHDIGAAIIGCFVVIHILAALKHHFVDKDVVLKRMLPFAKLEPNNTQRASS